MTDKEALKLALAVLEEWRKGFPDDWTDFDTEAVTAIRKALAEQPAQQDSTCNNALRIQGKAYPRTCKKCGLGPCVELAQQALDKKAENARELGLDYEPAQQEPVAWMTKTGSVWKTKADETDIPLYTSPPAQRTWVGLTDEQIESLYEKTESVNWARSFARAIEAAHGIKENT